MSFLKRAVPVGGKGGALVPFPDQKFAKDWPALYEYMTASQYPDGTSRKTCSLTLFCDDGVLKGCLNDKDANTVLFGAGKTLTTLLNALEGLLTAEDTPWRLSSGGGPARAKKS